MHSTKSKTKPKVNTGQQVTRLDFEAIGTSWTIEIFDWLDQEESRRLAGIIQSRIDEFDKHYSRFRNDSLVMAMTNPGSYKLPPDARPLFDTYRKLYGLTDGLMTPLVGAALAEAGYDAAYSFQQKQMHAPPSWNQALVYDFPALTVKVPVLLDLGAAGKGYLVDITGSLLKQEGIGSYCINAGGDMLHQGAAGDTIEVGLEHPDHDDMAIGVAKIGSQSICGSSGNRRKWGNLTHIINPKTLQSPKHIKALWVVADTALVADALATALFFVGPLQLQTDYTFEYAAMYDDNSLRHSKGFPATFFTDKDS